MRVAGRIFGWLLLLLGLMVTLRDALVWYDTGRFLPLSADEAWGLIRAFGRFRAPALGTIGEELWLGPLLLLAAAALFYLCRRTSRHPS